MYYIYIYMHTLWAPISVYFFPADHQGPHLGTLACTTAPTATWWEPLGLSLQVLRFKGNAKRIARGSLVSNRLWHLPASRQSLEDERPRWPNALSRPRRLERSVLRTYCKFVGPPKRVQGFVLQAGPIFILLWQLQEMALGGCEP